MEFSDIEAGIHILADAVSLKTDTSMICLLVHHREDGSTSADIRCEHAKIIDLCGLVVEICEGQGIPLDKFAHDLRAAKEVFDQHRKYKYISDD